MKISTKGRYALRMLYDLALHHEEGYVSLKDIADRQGISKKYLEQIVPLLNKTGLLRTNRGNKGGCYSMRLMDNPELRSEAVDSFQQGFASFTEK